jgi:hypothetical protein
MCFCERFVLLKHSKHLSCIRRLVLHFGNSEMREKNSEFLATEADEFEKYRSRFNAAKAILLI